MPITGMAEGVLRVSSAPKPQQLHAEALGSARVEAR
jgi:hypothetical protein